jgi:hypothetical protein
LWIWRESPRARKEAADRLIPIGWSSGAIQGERIAGDDAADHDEDVGEALLLQQLGGHPVRWPATSPRVKVTPDLSRSETGKTRAL